MFVEICKGHKCNGPNVRDLHLNKKCATNAENAHFFW